MTLTPRSGYLVFRRDLAKPITTNYVLPDGYTTASWRPGLSRMVPASGLSRGKFAVLSMMFSLLGRSSQHRVFVISAPDGSVAHYSVLFPKYFRFPFMGNDDLQIGGLWTEPRFRGLGLATYAVQEILRAEERPDRAYWYVVAENNLPSIRVAEKNSFIVNGFASRTRNFGSSLLARFEVVDRSDHSSSSNASGSGGEMEARDYSTVTELAGEEITTEQLDRLYHRYYWAGAYCAGKDVIEAACGTGPGLGCLGKRARSIRAGDYTPSILAIAQRHYGSRVDLRQFDAQAMPYEDRSADVVILFEAIYYLSDAAQFVSECRRVLRPGGQVLISTANKDLSDFNPSPHSYTYYGVAELSRLFSAHGFAAHCFGYLSVRDVSLRQKLLRPVKILARNLRLIPETMAAKRLLKRLVFGRLVTMPAEIQEGMVVCREPTSLVLDVPDREHKVIYCAAILQG